MAKSKYVDTAAIVQVIGAVFKNPKLLDDERYFFNEEDFPEKFHKILFGSIFNLHQLGAEEITINTIEDYLIQRPNILAIYKNNKGREYLEEITNKNITGAFDFYYNRVKKMSLFRAYESVGLDLSWLYDVNNFLDAKKKQQQEDFIDNQSLEQLAELIDNKIADIRLKYVDNATEVAKQAGSGIFQLIDKLETEPAIGYPLFGPIINSIVRGARLRKFYLRSAATGLGKAIPNSTIIPTPQGDKRVEDIKVGDYLFDAFGQPTRVLNVFPQGKKKVWEVVFKDGRKAKCCDEHLWSYCTEGQRKKAKEERKFYTKTLKEIAQLDLYKKGRGYQILVPMQKAVRYSEKQYHIKPYSFGLLLGDGSFRYQPSQKALLFSSENEILPNAIGEEMGWIVKKNSDLNYNWTFAWKEGSSSHTNVWVEEILKDYPELWNVKSEDKFIPLEYLEGSMEQRFNLLNGLLDSDGSVDKEKGRVSFYTISPRLRDDVCKLALSLGFKATVLEDSHKDTDICYRIEIIGTPEDKIKLFKLQRKKDLILQWFNNGKRKEHNLFNPIVEINDLGYEEEMTCFYVDNPEHLFLMNDFIVTHNTRSMIADACNFACNEIYINGSWQPNGTKEPTLFITTEQELDEIQTMMLAFVSEVDEEHILKGEYLTGEKERVMKAANIISNSPLYIHLLPNFNMQDIENTIKKNVREYGIKYVAHDYIHSSMAILSEISSKAGVKGLREDNVLFMISTRLKDLCNEYGIFIISSTQINGEYRDARIFDQNLLRGSKAIADKIDVGSHLLEVTREDLEALQPLLERQGWEQPAIKMAIYKNRGNKINNVLVWCKARREVCRIEPMFVTNYNYEPITVQDIQINVIERNS